MSTNRPTWRNLFILSEKLDSRWYPRLNFWYH